MEVERNTLSDAIGWFCIRSQPKHDAIAAQHLALLDEVEVYGPRIRWRTSRRGRSVWVTQPLFPGYLFARFDAGAMFRAVKHAPGVATVVHFGGRPVEVPAEAIAQLQSAVAPDTPLSLQVGDVVQVSEGAFAGLEAVVTRLMPGRQRVEVLLHFLGQFAPVEIHAGNVLRMPRHPLAAA